MKYETGKKVFDHIGSHVDVQEIVYYNSSCILNLVSIFVYNFFKKMGKTRHNLAEENAVAMQFAIILQ